MCLSFGSLPQMRHAVSAAPEFVASKSGPHLAGELKKKVKVSIRTDVFQMGHQLRCVKRSRLLNGAKLSDF